MNNESTNQQQRSSLLQHLHRKPEASEGSGRKIAEGNGVGSTICTELRKAENSILIYPSDGEDVSVLE